MKVKFTMISGKSHKCFMHVIWLLPCNFLKRYCTCLNGEGCSVGYSLQDNMKPQIESTIHSVDRPTFKTITQTIAGSANKILVEHQALNAVLLSARCQTPNVPVFWRLPSQSCDMDKKQAAKYFQVLTSNLKETE